MLTNFQYHIPTEKTLSSKVDLPVRVIRRVPTDRQLLQGELMQENAQNDGNNRLGLSPGCSSAGTDLIVSVLSVQPFAEP